VRLCWWNWIRQTPESAHLRFFVNGLVKLAPNRHLWQDVVYFFLPWQLKPHYKRLEDIIFTETEGWKSSLSKDNKLLPKSKLNILSADPRTFIERRIIEQNLIDVNIIKSVITTYYRNSEKLQFYRNCCNGTFTQTHTLAPSPCRKLT